VQKVWEGWERVNLLLPKIWILLEKGSAKFSKENSRMEF
jgi:hypothetical protein